VAQEQNKATWERYQNVNGHDRWYQSRLLGSSLNSSKAFGGGEHLKANGFE
jgi:hypothetical protein